MAQPPQVTRKQLNMDLYEHLYQLRKRVMTIGQSMENACNGYDNHEYSRYELQQALAKEAELVSSEMQEEYTTFVATLEAAIAELEQAITGIPDTFR